MVGAARGTAGSANGLSWQQVNEGVFVPVFMCDSFEAVSILWRGGLFTKQGTTPNNNNCSPWSAIREGKDDDVEVHATVVGL